MGEQGVAMIVEGFQGGQIFATGNRTTGGNRDMLLVGAAVVHVVGNINEALADGTGAGIFLDRLAGLDLGAAGGGTRGDVGGDDNGCGAISRAGIAAFPAGIQAGCAGVGGGLKLSAARAIAVDTQALAAVRTGIGCEISASDRLALADNAGLALLDDLSDQGIGLQVAFNKAAVDAIDIDGKHRIAFAGVVLPFAAGVGGVCHGFAPCGLGGGFGGTRGGGLGRLLALFVLCEGAQDFGRRGLK